MANGVSNTKREKLQARETKILDAAQQVLLTHRYRGAKMSMIAKQAGLAEGTLYLYYKNKDDIIAAVLARHWQDLTKGAKDALSSVQDSVEKLQAFATYHIENLVKNWSIIELGYVQYYAGNRDVASTVEFMRDYAALLDGVFKQGMDRGDFKPDLDLLFLRDLFFGTSEYAARSLMVQGREENVGQVVESLVQMIGSAAFSQQVSMGFDEGHSLSAITKKLEKITNRLEGLPS